jgi:hypothetical protein
LEVLHDVLAELKSDTSMRLSELVNYVLARIPHGPLPDDERGEMLVVQSVCAVELSWGEHILRSGFTFESCLSRGYFINSTDHRDAVTAIPIMSVLMIEQWARPKDTRFHLATLFCRLFHLDESGGDCYTYEKFHCYWEAIRHYSLAYSTNRDFVELEISKLYNSLGQKNAAFPDKVVRVRKIMRFSSEYKSFSSLVAGLNLKNVKNLKKHNQVSKEKILGHVFHLGGSNIGFDSLIFFEDSVGALVLLLISSKFSDGDAIQEIGELAEGYEDSMNEVRAHWISECESKVYFVANCWRENRNHRAIPKNAIILERNELKVLYGSLAQRPQLGKFIQTGTAVGGKEIRQEEDIQQLMTKRPGEEVERGDPAKKQKLGNK